MHTEPIHNLIQHLTALSTSLYRFDRKVSSRFISLFLWKILSEEVMLENGVAKAAKNNELDELGDHVAVQKMRGSFTKFMEEEIRSREELVRMLEEVKPEE